MKEGKAFQFTPGGIVEGLGLVEEPEPGKVHGSTANVAPPPAVAPVVPLRPLLVHVGQPLKPANVLKLARARVREIKHELRKHTALTKELSQLERLLAASKTGNK